MALPALTAAEGLPLPPEPGGRDTDGDRPEGAGGPAERLPHRQAPV
jgi:hypothetical protein